jgi:hypothetical protein
MSMSSLPHPAPPPSPRSPPRFSLDERIDSHQGHRRIMPAHTFAPDGAKLGERSAIFVEIEHVPGHAHNMLRPGAACGEDGHDIPVSGKFLA